MENKQLAQQIKENLMDVMMQVRNHHIPYRKLEDALCEAVDNALNLKK